MVKLSEHCLYEQRTKQALDSLIARGNRHYYVSGDDASIVQEYIAYIEDRKCVVKTCLESNYIKTYIDLYNLSRCDAIIMSCNHSNFTMIASLLGGKRKVITVWSRQEVQDKQTLYCQWDAIIDFIPYSNIPVNKVAILGHQGVADFFNQCGLFHVTAGSYLDAVVTILITNSSNHTLVKAIYPGYNVQLVHQTSVPQRKEQSCLRCHMQCVQGCRMYLDYHWYESQDIHVVSYHSFVDSTLWEQHRQHIPFNVAFYSFAGFGTHLLHSRFELDLRLNNKLTVNDLRLPDGTKFLVYHDDSSRGIMIDQQYFSSDLEHIQLNSLSSTMIELIMVCTEASEIHVIDSSYSVMFWLIQHTYGLFCDVPVFLHAIARPGRDTTIYTHNLPSNWRVV